MNGCSWTANTNCAVQSGFSPAGYTGNAVKFNFDVGLYGVSELRYDLDAEYPEMYLGLKVYFPLGTESPSVGPKFLYGTVPAGSNKLLRLWSQTIETYTSSGTTYPDARRYPIVGAQFSDSAGTGGAGVGVGDAGLKPSAGVYPFTGGTVSQLDTDSRPLLIDANRGRWLTLEMYAKQDTITATGTGNGIVRWWLDGTLLTESLNLDMYEVSYTGFGGGYVFGAVDRLLQNAGSCAYLGYFGASPTQRVF